MITSTDVPKPVVQPSSLSGPYWEAAAQGRLVIQCCSACGKLRHYPRLICDYCYSGEHEWKQSTGRGKVHSWMVAHHAFHASFASELPYTLLTVDLTEGVRALGRWHGDPDHKFSIGMPVKGSFVAREGGVDLVFSAVSG